MITGCDTGFGHHLARRLDNCGFTVYAGVLKESGQGATSLLLEQSERLHVIKLDVTEDNDVTRAVSHVKDICRRGELWAIVNNAGFFIPGDVELCTLSQYKRIAEVNLYGVIRITKAFLPFIRESRGRIINMSSIRGLYSRPGVIAYSLTKFGIEALSDALRVEMKKFGVKVSIIEPGVFDGCTAISSPEQIERLKAEVEEMWENATEEVRFTYGREYFNSMIKKQSEKGTGPWISPDPVLDAILDALLNQKPKARYLIGGAGWPIDFRTAIARVYRYLPESLGDALLAKFYKGSGLQKHSIFQSGMHYHPRFEDATSNKYEYCLMTKSELSLTYQAMKSSESEEKN
ncbi:hypothetical protein KUTeg_019800 [Tegillarca granosa]|uniref:Uncharacterized protein n=1 Tax=Tegillarca granosa TaxID=220873 RepID=A0ABQ9EFK8_TEGGR|nr:hypothetical protein KUTeg_019800 [Tegillarca granosa]